jgi:methylmalonyl-CoA decarboxylase subunit alpha
VTSRREAIDKLRRRRAKALQQGGPAKVAAHQVKGRLTARERIDVLFDPGTFVEVSMLTHSDNPDVGEDAAADAVVTGVGDINGRKAVVDATVLGGSNGRIGLRKHSSIGLSSR